MPRKGENIYKRKDKRWEARYIKERENNGKIRYGYCYAKSYREVKQKLFKAKEDLLTDQVTKTQNISIILQSMKLCESPNAITRAII